MMSFVRTSMIYMPKHKRQQQSVQAKMSQSLQPSGLRLKASQAVDFPNVHVEQLGSIGVTSIATRDFDPQQSQFSLSTPCFDIPFPIPLSLQTMIFNNMFQALWILCLQLSKTPRTFCKNKKEGHIVKECPTMPPK